MSVLEELKFETSRCISCSFCESVCPTLPAMDYRAIYGARGRVLLARELLNDIVSGGKSSLSISDPFYSCLDCQACFNVCPAGVNAGHISELVKGMVASNTGLVKNQEKNVAKMIAASIMKFNMPVGRIRDVSGWAKDIEFDWDSDTLLYTGGMYQLMAYSKALTDLEKKFNGKSIDKIAGIISRYPELINLVSPVYDFNIKKRMDNILRSIVNLLKNAGVKFKTLGENEPYPGTFLFELGYMDDFIEYGKRLKLLFDKNNVKNIITVDPHTYEVLKIIYPRYIDDFNYSVKHYLDFISGLEFVKSREKMVYHEPCHFSMHQEKYSEPLKFISRVGELTLPQHHGTNSFCCGGPDELLYPWLSDSISQKRFKELKNTGAEIIVTSCPICFVNLNKDGTVFDLAEILEERLNKK